MVKKGYKQTPEHIENARKARAGYKHSAATILKMSLAKKDIKLSEEHAKNIGLARKGRSDEEVMGKEKAEQKRIINSMIAKRTNSIRVGKTDVEIFGIEKAQHKAFINSIKHLGLKKGKTYEEMYGPQRAKEIRLKSGASNIGKIAWNKNKTLEEQFGVEEAKKKRLHLSNIRKDKTWEEIQGKEKADKRRIVVSNSNKGKHNIPKTEEAKAKMREKRKYIILPVKDTSIEVKIQDMLKKLELDFFTHQYMRIEHGYQCDIYVPVLNLVIECDGNYWHQYPTGREIDHIRTQELLDKGFKVLRLWEIEINGLSLEDFKKRLGEYQ